MKSPHLVKVHRKWVGRIRTSEGDLDILGKSLVNSVDLLDGVPAVGAGLDIDERMFKGGCGKKATVFSLSDSRTIKP